MAGTSSDSSPEQRETRVSVWLARQPLEPQVLPSWLSSYEQEVVAAFATGRFNEFIHSRWLVRQALYGASGVAPRLCRPAHGRLVASAEPEGWFLSLSHSHGLSACATAPSPGLGVDVEPLYRETDWRRIVRRWFTRGEQDWLLSQADERAFLRVWTLKEAWLKATGRGIANNLQTLEVHADGSLSGDRPDQHWAAAITDVDGFMIAVVWQTPADTKPAPPALTLVQADEHHDINPAHMDRITDPDWTLTMIGAQPGADHG